MEPNFFRYVWRHSTREQLGILALVVLSLPFYFASLNLPKAIVNGPIQGEGFATPEATGRFLTVALPVPGGDAIELFSGFDLTRMPMLFALSGLFLALVFVNGAFKLQVNTRKGELGERMLRRLRYELVDRVLRFPPQEFRRRKASEIATMVNAEVEQLGGFIGDAFVQPAYLGGLALTALVFILAQSFWLGVVALLVVLVQAFLIPQLRRPLLKLGRARQLAAREMAGRVGEIVDGIVEIHANDTSNLERADIAGRLGRIFRIRLEIYERKFFVKFLNNFLAQLTPFVFYTAGGYLAIRGQLDIGQLVAVIAAYKDLPGPIRDLINWDQQRLDAELKFAQVTEQFDPEELLAPELQRPDAPAPAALAGGLKVQSLAIADERGARLLQDVSLSARLDERIALIGPPGGGKEALAYALVRLLQAEPGRIAYGAHDLAALPERVTGRRIGFVGPDVYLWPTSVRENLLYALKHEPRGEAAAGLSADDIQEARRTGNMPADASADWVDYEAAGATGPGDIEARLKDALTLVGLGETAFEWGLRLRLDPQREPALAERLVAAAEGIAARLAEPAYASLIELFDEARYNRNATVAENILFGSSSHAAQSLDALPRNPHFRAVLAAAGIERDVLGMGLAIARTMVELFADLPADHPYFEQFSFIASADLPDYRAIVLRLGDDPGEADPETRERLLALPLRYIEARHRLGLVDAAMEKRFVAARALFRADLPAELRGAIEFFDRTRYNSAATIEDNLLTGRVAYGKVDAEARVRALLREVLARDGLEDEILRVGLDHAVGTGGRRLGLADRQRLGLARAVLKRPQLLVVDQALAALDPVSEEREMGRVLAWARAHGSGVVWALSRPHGARAFDRVVLLEGGRVTAQGGPEVADRFLARGAAEAPRPGPVAAAGAPS
ncbi:MAG: ABC transporter ATP-binding protein [Alphaproteobacteria bacterium]|nr:ABC transporter ATP-binding protein [Alphaproteobacteria bacterium]